MSEKAGQPIHYPVCGEWTCDDYDYDWEVVKPGDPEYQAVKREKQIVDYHQPRTDWRRRLQQERDEKSSGSPLWSPRNTHGAPS